jgi:hypothetical protein
LPPNVLPDVHEPEVPIVVVDLLLWTSRLPSTVEPHTRVRRAGAAVCDLGAALDDRGSGDRRPALGVAVARDRDPVERQRAARVDVDVAVDGRARQRAGHAFLTRTSPVIAASLVELAQSLLWPGPPGPGPGPPPQLASAASEGTKRPASTVPTPLAVS